MKVRFKNQQDALYSMNGHAILTTLQFAKLLDDRRQDEPFLANLTADNGYELMIGLGSGVACAQFSSPDGEPPYLMAVPPRRQAEERCVEFLMNNTPTAIGDANRVDLGVSE
jgi:hypothetical protein